MGTESRPPFKLGELSSADKERAMLDLVLKIANGNEHMIRAGITEALRGTNDHARRTYLWNILTMKAVANIRQRNAQAPKSDS